MDRRNASLFERTLAPSASDVKHLTGIVHVLRIEGRPCDDAMGDARGEGFRASRKRTRWDHVLQVLVAYRLIEPGSEWRLHREWFGKSAMADLLGADFGLAEAHKLYACHDLLLAHKDALFSHLTERWRDLFNANFDVLLYDLTSTYFEVNASDLPEGAKRRHGYSRDKRPDCPQLVIALVVTPEGLPLAYEVLPGNTADSKTLRTFLSKIEKQYGKARRVWVMDRGVPTEAVLAEMRASDPPVQYLVGTPKGRLNRLEKHLIEKPWQKARAGVEVKLLAQDDERSLHCLQATVWRRRTGPRQAARTRQLPFLIVAIVHRMGRRRGDFIRRRGGPCGRRSQRRSVRRERRGGDAIGLDFHSRSRRRLGTDPGASGGSFAPSEPSPPRDCLWDKSLGLFRRSRRSTVFPPMSTL